MAPPWVFLHHNVYFVDGEFTGGAGNASAAIGKPSGEPSLEEVTAALEPNRPAVADPPEITSLSMVRHLPKDLMRGINSGSVSSTDKGLVVLYAGSYRPGDGSHCKSGCYLVYDAATNSVAAIPQLDPPRRSAWPNIKCLGESAAILRLRHGADGAYVLAELVTTVYPGLPDANLYLWRSSSTANQWMLTSVRLPLPGELCGPTSFFHIDMAFAFGGSCVCWADLAAGVLICDLFASEGPKFSFVPLPQECCSYTTENTRIAFRFRASSSMGVVCGAIKFVALVGYERMSKEEVVLKTWTLSADFKDWKEGAAVLVRDLWESESFREMELPRVMPMNPVLSLNEDEVVYVSLNEIESVDRVDDYMQTVVGKDLVLNAHYVLRLDLLQNKVLHSKKSATNSLSLLRPIVLASDFSAYLHDGSKIRQREEEASKVETLVKRTKHCLNNRGLKQKCGRS